jgi:signal recognition particle receptor subunit alpha
LWSKTWTKIKNTIQDENPVNALIRSVLLEDKGGASRSAVIESYQMKWTFANEFDLVIVVVYQKVSLMRQSTK